ncbi:hypothetical protein QQ045_023883 [Rhodiola kirilowii]
MADGTRSSKQLEEDLKKTDDKVDKLASDMSQLSILMAQLVHQQQNLMEHFQNSTAHDLEYRTENYRRTDRRKNEQN